MNSKLLFSIVVPVYNIEKYIAKSVESIINQTYSNLEIILIDDGSTDSSGDICDTFGQMDNRIKVIHKKNGGLVSARKRGVYAASGTYITFVDGDDWIEKDHVEKIIRCIERTNADLIGMDGFIREYNNSSRIEGRQLSLTINNKDGIINAIVPFMINTNVCFERELKLGCWSSAFKLDILQRVYCDADDRVRTGEDMMCVWLFLMEAKSVACYPAFTYHYVQRDDSIGMTFDEKEKERLECLYRLGFEKIKKGNYGDNVWKAFLFMFVLVVMLADYRCLAFDNADPAFPFQDIKRGKRLAIYGAGKLGRHLAQAIDQDKTVQLQYIADKRNGTRIMGHTVITPEELAEKEDYDKILIAVLDASVAEEIESELIKKGVPHQKISRMSAEVLWEKQNLIEERFGA